MNYTNRSGAHNQTGSLGEKLAQRFLQDKGFRVLSSNYTKPYGEIDIVARATDSTVHFVEVKTLSYPNRAALEKAVIERSYNPEDHFDERKRQRLARVVQAWLGEFGDNAPWQIDVLAIRLAETERFASIQHLENITD